MKWLGRFGAVLLAAMTLAACAGTRPQTANCPAVKTGIEPGFAEQLIDMMNTRWNIPHGQPRAHIAILLLSGGGAWGAYGAGFVDGWSSRAQTIGEARPNFDVVTGVSTGAIIAPFAMLGSHYDPVLEKNYRGISSSDLFHMRSIFTLPFWNSLNKPDEMKEKLKAALDDQTIAGLRAAAAQGRSVWVGAVNFDTGEFSEFDLTSYATTMPPDSARKAIVNRIMAASAIPVFLPPSFIGGCMYLDGGVRENLFISQIAHSIEKSLAGWRAGGDANVDLYAVLNGPVKPMRYLVNNSLVAIGTRGFDLGAEQIQLASLREVYDFAKRNGFTLHWTSADDVVTEPGQPAPPGMCTPPSATTDGFDASFTACLFDAGRRKAMTDRAPWRTDRP
jgi:predicted acylesterase/phospholipase RssA